jgi:hypothetical protein
LRTRQHGVGGLDAAARGEQRDFVAARADAGTVADRTAARRRQPAHGLDVALGVKISQLPVLGRTRLDAGELVTEAADFNQRQ